MFDNTSLDQFSALEELSSVTPVWRPFVQREAPAPAVKQECTQQTAECHH
jgi:hypothetical protein